MGVIVQMTFILLIFKLIFVSIGILTNKLQNMVDFEALFFISFRRPRLTKSHTERRPIYMIGLVSPNLNSQVTSIWVFALLWYHLSLHQCLSGETT